MASQKAKACMAAAKELEKEEEAQSHNSRCIAETLFSFFHFWVQLFKLSLRRWMSVQIKSCNVKLMDVTQVILW
jgi:hypothetical protein